MPSNTLWAVLGIVGFSLALDVFLVRTLVRAGWSTLSDRFPAQPVAPDAIRRDFQSFGFDLYSFGGCVHVAADSSFLHLLPSAFLRWAGCGAMSIPWERIELKSCRRRWAKAQIAGTRVKGPAWCLSLADPGPGAGHAASGP
jgi:hypothetical protein